MNETNNKKIIIVEDNKDFMWLLTHGFTKHGLPVIGAADGQEGLQMAKKEHPDLMIIDILLPKMDGIAMAKAIREEGIKTKMIFLTNLKDAEHVSQAIDVAGNADYIIKSDTNIEAIVKRVKEKLGIK